MEAIIIEIHGRPVCKLIDKEKVNKVKLDLSKHWENELKKIVVDHRPEPLELVK